MVDKIFNHHQNNKPIQRVTAANVLPVHNQPGAPQSFEKMLDEAGDIKFSAHARKRVESRNIQLEISDFSKINEAINKAATKGAKNSVLLMGKAAFIVNVKNRTVVTAVNKENLKDSIFTYIDSVIIT